MTRLGMSADVVERNGRALQREAERLAVTLDQIDHLISGLRGTWFGRSATRLTDERWPQSRVQLRQVVEAISGLGQSALNNAAEQRRVSGREDLGIAHLSPWDVRTLPSIDGIWSDFPWDAGHSIGDLLRNVTFDEGGIDLRESDQWQAEFRRDAYWSGEFDGARATADAEFRARAEAGTYRTMDLGPDGLQAGVGGHAEMSAVATGSVSLAVGAAQLRAQGSAYARARAEGTAGVRIGPDGVHARAKVGVQAAAGVSGEVSAEIAGVKGTAEGTLEVGLDAHAEADLAVSLDEVRLTVDAGLALGIGGGVQFDVSIDPQEVIDTIDDIFPDPPSFSFPW